MVVAALFVFFDLRSKKERKLPAASFICGALAKSRGSVDHLQLGIHPWSFYANHTNCQLAQAVFLLTAGQFQASLGQCPCDTHTGNLRRQQHHQLVHFVMCKRSFVRPDDHANANYITTFLCPSRS